MSRRYTKLVHEGEYAAEVEVDLITTDEGWYRIYPSRMQNGSIPSVRRCVAVIFVRPAGRLASTI